LKLVNQTRNLTDEGCRVERFCNVGIEARFESGFTVAIAHISGYRYGRSAAIWYSSIRTFPARFRSFRNGRIDDGMPEVLRLLQAKLGLLRPGLNRYLSDPVDAFARDTAYAVWINYEMQIY
jgi:hypothetical protein